MTGAGPGRGGRARGGRARGGAQPVRDRCRERGADRYERAGSEDPFDSAAWSSGASLEELPSLQLPVVPRRGPRLGLGGTLAVVAAAALLATGFGILGGRPNPSPSAPLGVVVPVEPASIGPAPTPGAVSTPQVTPFTECAANPPTSAPDVLLQVNGVPTPGFVKLLQWPEDASPLPNASIPGAPERVTIPVDVITEVWIVGGACAYGWNIGLVGNPVLNSFINRDLNPAIAAQNRFALTLAPFAGRDMNLRADLFFPTVIARAIWPIHVQTFERPIAGLQNENDPRSIVEGCDVELTLGNDYVYPRDPSCTDDLPFEPETTLEIGAGEVLQFGLGDWDVSNGVLTCGRLSGLSFIAEPEPGCFLEATGHSTPSTYLTFPALPADLEAGAWTLAISACALSGGSMAINRICGTWYVNVEVEA